MKTYSLSKDADFRASCVALGIDPDHPFAGELLTAACDEAAFAFADAYADLYAESEPFDA